MPKWAEAKRGLAFWASGCHGCCAPAAWATVGMQECISWPSDRHRRAQPMSACMLPRDGRTPRRRARKARSGLASRLGPARVEQREHARGWATPTLGLEACGGPLAAKHATRRRARLLRFRMGLKCNPSAPSPSLALLPPHAVQHSATPAHCRLFCSRPDVPNLAELNPLGRRVCDPRIARHLLRRTASPAPRPQLIAHDPYLSHRLAAASPPQISAPMPFFSSPLLVVQCAL